MPKILNEHILQPPPDVIKTFKRGMCKKDLIKHTVNKELFRIVTCKDERKSIVGNNMIEGCFWIDKATFTQISAKINVEKTLLSMTNVIRSGLAITTEFSQMADGFIGIHLKQDIYGWFGPTARQTEQMKNGMRVTYPGGMCQWWIPNLSVQSASFSFFHSI